MYDIEFRYDRIEAFDNKRKMWVAHPVAVAAYVREQGAEGVTLVGEATCHEKDNFVKEVGRKLALSRAISSLPAEERKKVWDKYFNR